MRNGGDDGAVGCAEDGRADCQRGGHFRFGTQDDAENVPAATELHVKFEFEGAHRVHRPTVREVEALRSWLHRSHGPVPRCLHRVNRPAR